MQKKTLCSFLIFLCLNVAVSFAVNSSTAKEEKVKLDQENSKKSKLSFKQKVSLILIKKLSKQKAKKKNKTDKRKLNGAAAISFFGGILSIVGLLVVLATSNLVLILLLGLLGSAAFFLGINGLKKIKSEPDVYKGKALSIIGIVLGSISSIFLLFLLVVTAIALAVFYIF